MTTPKPVSYTHLDVYKRQAGYSPKTAYSMGNENLNKPELKAYIETELEKLHSAKIADAEEVMKYLTSVMRGEHTEEIPILCLSLIHI